MIDQDLNGRANFRFVGENDGEAINQGRFLLDCIVVKKFEILRLRRIDWPVRL